MAEKGAGRNAERADRGTAFRVQGTVALPEGGAGDAELHAYVFDRAGTALGSGPVDAKGNFDVGVALEQPTEVEVMVGPEEEPQVVRRSAGASKRSKAEEWKKTASGYTLSPTLRVSAETLQLLIRRRICVSGHIRKIDTHANGTTEICPVPFVKVEVFDVDREGCLWPYYRRWWEHLFDRPVIRLPDLLREPPPIPRPIPDPIGPVIRGVTSGLPPVPQPDPAPFAAGMAARSSLSRTQNIEAATTPLSSSLSERMAIPSGRVGEVARIDESIAERLERLTITSVDAPWTIFPLCFYSRQLVCEATTDCSGYFRCCFNWWPFHLRRGRLRWDWTPDIIIRVTQVINGVTTVLYMDPYSGTRWNAGSTHIDLFLDDDRIACGTGCHDDPPEGSPIFFTRIGHDEVYKIVQSGSKTGLLDQTPHGGTLENWAYGGDLRIHAAIGADLASGAPQRYYRLQIRRGSAGTFKDIVRTLDDTRVHKSTFVSQKVTLGPFSVGGVDNLYEIRDMQNYYWYSPDLIGRWNTLPDEPDEGLYTLRLEVFDDAGNHLTSAVVDYRDGTVAPPGPLPQLVDRCEMKIQVDNKAPVFDFTVPGANPCGIISCPSGTIAVQLSANQENGRLYSWSLSAYKGLSYTYVGGTSDLDVAGITPLPVNVTQPFPAISTTETCAYAITLGGWSLIRNGISAVHHSSVTKAIAVEKCA